MATLIPSFSTCTARMTSGERRLAKRLEDKLDDDFPLVEPISCGRDDQEPLIIRLPTLRDEARKIAEPLSDAHQEGQAWGDMAVICRDYATMDECAHALSHRKLPHLGASARATTNPTATPSTC